MEISQASTDMYDCGNNGVPVQTSLVVAPSLSNSVDRYEPTATDLMKASYDLDVEIVKLAISIGQSPLDKDAKGYTASNYACAGRWFALSGIYARYPNKETLKREKLTPWEREKMDEITRKFCCIIRTLSAAVSCEEEKNNSFAVAAQGESL